MVAEAKNDLSAYVSGGYYVLKAVPRPADLSEILPETLITVSSCFTTMVRDIIQLQWDNYDSVREAIDDEAREFGIPRSRIPDLVTWAKTQHNTNYTVYSRLEPAFELRNRFITDPTVHVIGIGLHTSLLGSFRSQLPKDANCGLGLAELVDELQPPAEGGRHLGFEPLGYDATKFHSWLCHCAPDEVFKHFGTRPNQLGLIDNFDAARQANKYLLEAGAEPAIWEPWLLLDHTPRATQA